MDGGREREKSAPNLFSRIGNMIIKVIMTAVKEAGTHSSLPGSELYFSLTFSNTYTKSKRHFCETQYFEQNAIP